MWEICLSSKMHGSTRSSKAFYGKLSLIEAVDLEFTSASQDYGARFSRERFALPKVLVPLEAAFQPFWVKLLLPLPPC